MQLSPFAVATTLLAATGVLGASRKVNFFETVDDCKNDVNGDKHGMSGLTQNLVKSIGSQYNYVTSAGPYYYYMSEANCKGHTITFKNSASCQELTMNGERVNSIFPKSDI